MLDIQCLFPFIMLVWKCSIILNVCCWIAFTFFNLTEKSILAKSYHLSYATCQTRHTFFWSFSGEDTVKQAKQDLVNVLLTSCLFIKCRFLFPFKCFSRHKCQTRRPLGSTLKASIQSPRCHKSWLMWRHNGHLSNSKIVELQYKLIKVTGYYICNVSLEILWSAT